MNESFYYVSPTKEDIDYYIFEVEFPNKELKNVITSLSNSIPNMYPQIYAPQMFYQKLEEKHLFFQLKYN